MATRHRVTPPHVHFVNQAGWDRILRIVAGVVMLAAGWWLTPDGLLGALLRVFGPIPLATGLIGWSPLYAILGVSTRRPRLLSNGSSSSRGAP